MMLKKLPIGARVLEPRSKLVFLVAGYEGHAAEGAIPMISERVTTAASFDAAEPLHEEADKYDGYKKYGFNNYEKSNVHLWLNSTDKVWYKPQHETDAPPEKENTRYGEMPAVEQEGYLRRFSDAFLNALALTDVPVLTRTARNEGEIHYVKAKMYLPSRTEVIKGDESGFAEGRPLPICYDPGKVCMIQPTDEDMEKYGSSWNPPHEGAPMGAPQIYDPKYAWWYFLRTPSLQYGFLVRNIASYGALSYTYANNDIVGIRPMCNLYAETEVELEHPMMPGPNGVDVRLYSIKA